MEIISPSYIFHLTTSLVRCDKCLAPEEFLRTILATENLKVQALKAYF